MFHCLLILLLFFILRLRSILCRLQMLLWLLLGVLRRRWKQNSLLCVFKLAATKALIKSCRMMQKTSMQHVKEPLQILSMTKGVLIIQHMLYRLLGECHWHISTIF